MTAERAVSAGYWRVGFPTFVVMMVFMWTPCLFFGRAAFYTQLPATGTGIVAGIAFGWLTWSLLAPRWRLWAYERVDDIEELKTLAVTDKLVWPDSHLLSRTEITTRAMREQLAALEAKRSR